MRMSDDHHRRGGLFGESDQPRRLPRARLRQRFVAELDDDISFGTDPCEPAADFGGVSRRAVAVKFQSQINVRGCHVDSLTPGVKYKRQRSGSRLPAVSIAHDLF